MSKEETPRQAWREIVELVAELDPKLELAPVGRKLREAAPETQAAVAILAAATRAAVVETPAEGA